MDNLSSGASQLRVLTILCLVLQGSAAADVNALPMFIFGDSTADVGTNNFLPNCQVRADILYNGIDYPSRVPTGRYGNGYNTLDFLAMQMGHEKSPSPFLYLVTEVGSRFISEIMGGVNFASGGSGILDHTGNQFVQVIPFSQQIEQFMTVYNNITEAIGANVATILMKKSVFVFSVGSNDILEYFQFNHTIGPDMFLAMLVKQYETQLRKLLDIGARKFGIISVASLGCLPRALALIGNGNCVPILNTTAQEFFPLVQKLLQKLTLEYQGMKYSLGDTYQMTSLVMKNPKSFGFTEIKTACCGNGTFNGEAPCNTSANICPNRSEYLFWDRFHPSQAAANLTAFTLYNGLAPLVSPINFSQLAA